jgi:hypothetical protein
VFARRRLKRESADGPCRGRSWSLNLAERVPPVAAHRRAVQGPPLPTNRQVVIDADIHLVVTAGTPLPGNRNDCRTFGESGFERAHATTM